MGIRIAIHGKGVGFTERWIAYCEEKGIEHKLVDCRDTHIITELREFDALLWHFSHYEPIDLLMARHVLMSAEKMGLAVFPNVNTAWYFDDKLAEKYILEAVGAPLVKTDAFFDKASALEWLRQASYPIVRKLRRGSGSHNVGLIRGFNEGRRFCNRMFGAGKTPVSAALGDTRRRVTQINNWEVFRRRVLGAPRYILQQRNLRRRTPKERDYVLFQEFIPGNKYDIRISVIGDRAWGLTREVRPGDFRASGSGRKSYDLDKVPIDCVRAAFETSAALQCQSMAYDFMVDPSGQPKIVEVSFGFPSPGIFVAPGHWTPDLEWHEGHTWPGDAILEDLIASLGK